MKCPITALMTAFSIFLAAAPALPTIYTDTDGDAPQVKQTGSFTRTEIRNYRNDQETPRGMSAGRLAVNGIKFSWTPSQITGKATGGADLINAILSSDESLLLIAERIGGSGQLNSTRFILFNLKNNKIINGFQLEKRRISDIMFIPGSDTILAIQSAQKESEYKNAVIKINLKSGKVTESTLPAPAEIASFCSDGSSLWYTVRNDTMIFKADLENLSGKQEKIRTRTENPRLLISPDQTQVITFGEKFIETYAVKDSGLALVNTTELTDKISPQQAVALNDNANFLLIYESGKNALLIQNGSVKNISTRAGSTAAFFPKQNLLLLGTQMQNGLLKIQLPDGVQVEKPIVPGKLKPLSRNDNWKLLPLSGSREEAILIDHRGNIMRLESSKRRWKKFPLLTVDKSGFR